jgi:hypothetical protein
MRREQRLLVLIKLRAVQHALVQQRLQVLDLAPHHVQTTRIHPAHG